ncbi:MAG: hypothetical protein K2X27_26020, partial [Candidatus Obscuribacterales bacterium]|nr:hypothetical protein [Candidatus Obscuribacterales bacterium]
MTCSCPGNDHFNQQVLKIESDLAEVAETARRLVKTASDPFTAVIRFLHERPEHVSLNAESVKSVLLDSFG